MNPPEYYGSKANEDPQDFIEEIFKIVDIMGVSSTEKAELAVYQLKGIAQIWYTQWKASRLDDDGVIPRTSKHESKQKSPKCCSLPVSVSRAQRNPSRPVKLKTEDRKSTRLNSSH